MVEAIRAYAAEAAALQGVDLADVTGEIAVVHVREALEPLGADPEEPDLSPAHERALSAWAHTAHGSDVLAVEGYPMVQRPFCAVP